MKMWRSLCNLLRQSVTSPAARLYNNPRKCCGFLVTRPNASLLSSLSTASWSELKMNGYNDSSNTSISCSEARKLLRLVDVEALKLKLLGTDGKDVIPYKDMVEACQGFGFVKSPEEAAAFAHVLDEAGVVLLFRDMVYLHPHKVVDLVRKVMPLALLPDDDLRLDELKKLQEKKDELDIMAHKQVRLILWGGYGFTVFQASLFFRLKFWELSSDVMEPIEYLTAATVVVVGYAYFLFTSKSPTYQDLMKRLFLWRQKKLIKKHSFDIVRFLELQRQCNHRCEKCGCLSPKPS